MAAQGWLTIAEGDDARSRLVKATPEGLDKRAQGQRAWKEAQSELNMLLGEEQVLALHALLDASITTLDEGAESAGSHSGV